MHGHELIRCSTQFIRPGLTCIGGARNNAPLTNDCAVVHICKGDTPESIEDSIGLKLPCRAAVCSVQNTCTGTHSGSMVSVSKGDGIQLILSTVGLIDPTRAAIGGPQNCRISPSESVTDYGSSVSVGERNATKIACYSTCLRLPCRHRLCVGWYQRIRIQSLC